MAQRMVLSDDIDGSTDDVQSVTYEVDDTEYKIDLSVENREHLENSLTALRKAKEAYEEARSDLWYFTQHATRAGASATPRKRNRAIYDDFTNQDIRDWAVKAGLEVNPRGRVSAEIIEKHKEAHAK